MESTAKFVTISDVENYLGLNLVDKLKGEKQADIFIRITEEEIIAWLNANTFRSINFDKLTDFELEKFKKAIMHQVYYNYRNGLLMYDSGIDPQKGVITKKEDLKDAEICEPTINMLKTSGLYTHAFQNGWRYTRSL